MDPSLLASVRARAARQDDVLSLAQLRRLGVSPDAAERLVRRSAWQRLHRGVVVVHSGPVGWRARARGALLVAGPGALLSHGSAGHVLEYVSRAPRLIDVSIPEPRRVVQPDGVRIHRRRHLDGEWAGRFPVTTRGSTVLDLVSLARSDDDAVALVCAALAARTAPEQVLEALQSRTRFAQRALLLELLEVAEEGVESALERRYHRDVERAHGLPRAERQEWELVDGRWIRSDVRYPRFRVRVELDGRLAHPGGRTDADTWRDNAVLLEASELTLRYRWTHVVGGRCASAGQVARALRRGGWDGAPRACSPTCPLGAR